MLLKAAADAGLKVNWYTYYAGGTGGPTAIKQANLNHQVFAVGEGIPNLDHASSQEFEKALRAKYDFSLFYPRAVNEMRMLAAAADKAKSIDPVKVAFALEGMEFEVFDGGKGYMRKDDRQFLQQLHRLVWRSHGKGTVRRGKDRLGLEASGEDRYARDRPSDHLQDGTAELTPSRVDLTFASRDHGWSGTECQIRSASGGSRA